MSLFCVANKIITLKTCKYLSKICERMEHRHNPLLYGVCNGTRKDSSTLTVYSFTAIARKREILCNPFYYPYGKMQFSLLQYVINKKEKSKDLFD
jgi:hypothetical protein